MIKNAPAVALPWALVALIRWLDGSDKPAMSTLELGSRDEPAHLATSVLVLLALLGPGRLLRHRRETATACAASVLIDLDHLPLYVDLPHLDVAVDGGRPFTHSVTTIAGLVAAAATVRRHRSSLAAAAAGVGLHFVRDVATGSGLPVWWPVEQRGRRLPYSYYSRALIGLAATGSLRIYREGGS